MGSFWAVVISLAYGSLSSVGHLAWISHILTFRYITAACYGHLQVNPIVTFRNIPPGSTFVPSYVCTIGSAYLTDRLSLWYVCTLVRLLYGTSVPLAQLMVDISQAYGILVLEYACTRASLLRMTLSSNKNGSHYRSY
jgi:hypothetical protein